MRDLDPLSSSPSLDEDEVLLHEAVRAAGTLALSYFGAPVSQWTKEADHTPVSEADLAVDALLTEHLRQARRGYGWLSEETGDDLSRLEAGKTWIVDPIDGTRAFLKGRPHFTISVALVEHGNPILAAVLNPVLDELFTARRGRGSWLNGLPVKTSQCESLEGCRMAAFQGMFRPAIWPTPWPEMEIVERNSMAYRLALVAAGLADAAITLTGKSDWDLAAAHLLVEEAGGRVTTHQGQPLSYNRPTTRHQSLIAAGPVLHTEILKRVKSVTLG